MSGHRRIQPTVEMLETRWVPALLLQLDSGGNLTGIFGVPSGDVDLVFTATGEVEVLEAANSLGTYAVPGNLRVSLGNVIAATAVNVDLGGNAMSGNLTIGVGNGLNGYSVNIDGAGGGAIGGSVSVMTGSGPDTVVLANDNDIAGNFTVNTGAGFDTVEIVDDVDVAGSITATNTQQFFLNTFGVADVTVGGSVKVDASKEGALLNDYDLNNAGASLTINGNVILSTGNSTLGDSVILNATVLGSAIITQGNGTNQVLLDSEVVIGGDVTVRGGTGQDPTTLSNGGTVLGRVTIVYGNGDNTFDFQDGSTIGGSAITYIGGSGLDTLLLNGQAVGARASATLGAGTDGVQLGANVRLASLYVDFGTGVDTLDQLLAAITFPTTFRNLP